MNYIPFFRHLAKLFFNLLQSKNLYPQQKTGRPRSNIIKVFHAILRKLVYGLPWRKIPSKWGAWRTVYGYFQEWASAGLFCELWQFIIHDSQAVISSANRIQFIDGSEKITKNMNTQQASMGYKHKSKHAVKLTLIVNALGIPLGLDIHGAGCSDVSRLDSALDSRVINPAKSNPVVLLGDKGYIGRTAINIAAKHDSILFTPAKKSEKRKNTHQVSALLKQRNIVERTFEKLYNFKRIDEVLDRSISSYMAWCHLGMALHSILQIFKI